MRFDKISDTELRCRIPIEEIRKEGLEPNDLLKRDEKAYNFLQDVIRRGEEETGFENNGPMSVQGTVTNNSLELIFRVLREEDVEAFRQQLDRERMEYLCDMRSKPVLPPQAEDTSTWLEPITVIFNDIADVYSFARRLNINGSTASLYTYRDKYVLRYDFDECGKTPAGDICQIVTRSDAGRLCQLANEFSCQAVYGQKNAAFITTEHGRLITKNFMIFV